MAIKEEKKEQILKSNNIFKTLLVFSIPIMLNNLIKSFHDAVDALLVARMPVDEITKTSALAALDIHWPIIGVFLAIGTGVGFAIVAILGQYIGSKRKDLAEKYASQFTFISFALGVALSLVFLFLSDIFWGDNLFAVLLGANGKTLEFANEYFLIRSFELPFAFLFIAYSSIRQSTGETKKPVIYSMSAVLINLILTYILVVPLNMGPNGAAIATVFSQAIIVPFFMYDLFTSKNHIRIYKDKLIPDKLTLTNILKIAIPASFGNAVANLGFAVIKFQTLSYGPNVSTAFSGGSRISSIILNPIAALSSVSALFISINIGNNRIDRAKKAFKYSTITAFSLLLVICAIIIPLREPIISFIIKEPIGSETLTLATKYAFVLLLTQPLMGIFQGYIGLFNGTGDTKYAMFMELFRLWILRMPLIFIFKLFILDKSDPMGIGYAMLISNILILFVGEFLKRKVRFNIKVDFNQNSNLKPAFETGEQDIVISDSNEDINEEDNES